VLIENNIIELGLRRLTDYAHASGIIAYVGGFPPQNIIRQSVARNNIIRQIDNTSDPSTLISNRGIEVDGNNGSGVESAVVEKNFIRLDIVARATLGVPGPIEFRDSGLATFDNRTPDGTLLPAINADLSTIRIKDEVTHIQSDIEDALIASFLT
jgi:hypothetical protein